ncbi:hypothetical protein F0U44_20665 [Nocardioides humilatus]|uniref:Uncharacterized protein n=1 Tax=Nocardioides humilatus TaxID=2607660 RepID=A0A5B1L6K4_9ACTN|nr:DUF6049 family protein [Nocardioides humilatus]KAA1415410.1 hypothetical protein F0U44_20665 [Nocardioides humilatus]
MVFRRLTLHAALAAVSAGLLIAAPASAEGTAKARAYDAPLLITIDELTPGEVPDRGPVVVSGTVTNRDVETWSGISLYPFINAGDCPGCPAPMTTSRELVAAAETDPETVVGNRITDVSASIEELEPGEVAPYSISVPRRLLPVTTPGVYWFGVHASGQSESTPRDDFADGRARTFLPYVPRGPGGVKGAVDTAIVVPLRYRIRYLPSGALAHRQEWADAFDTTGELGGPLAFGSSAIGKPVNWLVDPAVLDAARRLRRGNPPRDLGPESDDAGTEPTDAPSDEAEDETDPTDDPIAQAAGRWLDSVEVQLRDEEVLELPYGDLDMSATPQWLPDLYPIARERTSDVLSAWETPTIPVIASPGGYLDPSALPGIDDDSTLLVTDRMFGRTEFPNGAPVVGDYDGHAVAATSYGAATGGPGPEPRLSAISFRQRVLAEAAVRLTTPGKRHPLIVVVPRDVDIHRAVTFWDGLEADWLHLTTVSEATDRTPTTVDPSSLSYPANQETAELDSTVFHEVSRLINDGRTLQNLLTEAGAVAGDVRDEALAGASYHFRTAPAGDAERLARSRRWIERRLGSVDIKGPPGVTLASADGTFAVTVNNHLNRTVTVRIAATSEDGELTIDVGDEVVLAAGSRTTIPLEAHAKDTGVHNVTLSVTDVDGTELGSSVEVPIRSGQVSEVIWLILGSGVAILFVAIALRLYRRFRGRKKAAA